MGRNDKRREKRMRVVRKSREVEYERGGGIREGIIIKRSGGTKKEWEDRKSEGGFKRLAGVRVRWARKRRRRRQGAD